ncbi:MAG: N-acetylneuraminate synthase family protein [Enterobacteriaceae bacterium]|nr:N-acetylneuraminate synthase family protein [Enterobacteriaceae bacterium]
MTIKEICKGKTFIIAEIGINHNGDINIAKKLIDIAVDCGCDAVKFQKRTINLVYTEAELNQKRRTPFGTLNLHLKEALEFNNDQYRQIDEHCKKRKILWSASCWDEKSWYFINKFKVPFLKIPSALLTNDCLLKDAKKFKKPIILSTGMSTIKQIDHAIQVLGKKNIVLMHSTGTYPTLPEEVNLKMITTLQKRYKIPIGYSGHELDILVSVLAVALGARAIEKHITLDRKMWGSDQNSSIEPDELKRMVQLIREAEFLLGDGKKKIYPREIPIIKKLRR